MINSESHPTIHNITHHSVTSSPTCTNLYQKSSHLPQDSKNQNPHKLLHLILSTLPPNPSRTFTQPFEDSFRISQTSSDNSLHKCRHRIH